MVPIAVRLRETALPELILVCRFYPLDSFGAQTPRDTTISFAILLEQILVFLWEGVAGAVRYSNFIITERLLYSRSSLNGLTDANPVTRSVRTEF